MQNTKPSNPYDVPGVTACHSGAAAEAPTSVLPNLVGITSYTRKSFVCSFAFVPPPPMSKSRPFRILALPLVRIPHGPLRVSGIKAALDASKVASSSGASSVSASAASTAGSTAGGSSTVAESTSATPAAPQGHGVAPEATEAPLVLYHVQQPDIPKNAGKQPLYQRALDKAADEWTKLSTKKPDSWMYWFWQKGEHMMDKIEYEEWALKNVHEGRGVKIAKEGETQEKIEVSGGGLWGWRGSSALGR